MGDYTLDDLKDDTSRQYEAMKKKKSRLYHLARQLGFSSMEAQVLQNKSEGIIRELAREKNKQER